MTKNTSIPFIYVKSKNKPLILYFTIFDIEDYNKFKDIIHNNIPKQIVFTIFI